MGFWSFIARLFGDDASRSPPLPPRDPRAPGGMPYGASTPAGVGTGGGARKTPRPAQAAPVKLNLDPGHFAPISRAEVAKRAGELRWTWASVNFDRRDQIPSAGDPRTVLIDRALVAQGLLTPEQLVEIHETGSQMTELRPELRNLQNIAGDAVLADAAERLARREAKKAESERRRQEHIEAVRRRRATDIVFLGRGVSGGLADRRANIERLQTLGLPVLATPADVAKALGLEVSRLRWLAFHSEAAAVTHYVRFSDSQEERRHPRAGRAAPRYGALPGVGSNANPGSGGAARRGARVSWRGAAR